MRRLWDHQRVIAVAVGGVAGTGLRWAVLTSVEPKRFPWPVLALNVVGSVVLGIVLAAEEGHPGMRVVLHDAAGIGFCGGLTTFSTFSLEAVNLVRSGDAALATIYVAASVLGAMAGVALGAHALRRLRAVMLPLEEEP